MQFKACYKCTKRTIGCHSTCKDYKKETNTNEKEKKKKKEFNSFGRASRNAISWSHSSLSCRSHKY